MLKSKRNLISLLAIFLIVGCSSVKAPAPEECPYLKPCDPTFTEVFDETVLGDDGSQFTSVFFVYESPGKELSKEVECLIKRIGDREENESVVYISLNDTSLDAFLIYILDFNLDSFLALELSMRPDGTALEGYVSVYVPLSSVLHNMADAKEKVAKPKKMEEVILLQQGVAQIPVKEYTPFRRFLTNGKFPAAK